MTVVDKLERSISAIVVTFNTGPVLAQCLAALASEPGVCEVILVDNGNPDGDVDAAMKAALGGAPIRLIAGQGNVGFAVACNMGARMASGEMLLFVNPDALIPPGGAAALAKSGEACGGSWLMGAKIVDPDGAEQRGSRRATLTPWRAFIETTRLYALAPRHPYFRRFNLHGDPCPADVTPVPVISGACFMTPKADYWAIGGMDERYFLHVEDVDFCLRFAEGGGKVYFNPHVAVIHFRSTSDVDPVFVRMRKTSSMLRYFRTHFSEPYPAPFMWFLSLLLWTKFAASASLIILKRTFSLRPGGARSQRASGSATSNR